LNDADAAADAARADSHRVCRRSNRLICRGVASHAASTASAASAYASTASASHYKVGNGGTFCDI
jgi:hypothetical protein